MKYRRLQPGEKFNKWTIIKKAEKPRHWECLCECGNTGVVFGPNLPTNKSKSCGCNWATFVPPNKKLVADAAFNMIYSSYKRRANEKQRNFELTEEQFKELIFSDCYYCPSPPSNYRNYKGKDNFIFKYNGIDRIDSSLGYTLDNCVSCCSKCNYMKQDLSLDDFLNQIKLIYERHIKGE